MFRVGPYFYSESRNNFEKNNSNQSRTISGVSVDSYFSIPYAKTGFPIDAL